ncbi:hypothetical protein [Pseudohongiella spirulinae]|uniref:Uncharacterized protein n=1 Tax=Pseudohongiella spirulinae TaxID=1249552 RepID=A0A0S2KBB5_9GAMM|nr:hypothetical protein [Pseudohongiella spirulinae]ALO45628.1 hypothetical protein PS2015_958 [Pseudohongiella spirulinae]
MTDTDDLDVALKQLLRPEGSAADEQFVPLVLGRIQRQQRRQSILIACLALCSIALLLAPAFKLSQLYAPFAIQWQSLTFHLSPALISSTLLALAVGVCALLLQRLFHYYN